MIADADPGFRVVPPEPPRSPEAAEFFRTHPEFNVDDSLDFLVAHYPDTSTWIVDSGIAVQALAGRRDSIPSDIDIVSIDEGMEDDFGHSNGLVPGDRRYIDVKSVSHWMLGRDISTLDPETLWYYLSELSLPRDISGHDVRIMHPAILAATKSTMARMAVRPKDTADLQLLAVDRDEIEAATALLQGHDPERHAQFLLARSKY